MNKQKQGGLSCYIRLTDAKEKEKLFSENPNLRAKVRYLPDGRGKRIAVIRVGSLGDIYRNLENFCRVIGLRYYESVGCEIYVRRSSRAPLSLWSKRLIRR